MRSTAFTLVELMAVVALMGLLATAVAWSMAQDTRRATLDGVIARVAQADALARIAARRGGIGQTLRFELDAGRIQRFTLDGGAAVAAGPRVNIPDGYRLDGVIVGPGVTAPGAPAPLPVEYGRVEVNFGSDGLAPTYALRLRFQPLEPSPRPEPSAFANNGTLWLVFAGLTGQVTLIDDTQQIDNLFAALAGAGTDAD